MSYFTGEIIEGINLPSLIAADLYALKKGNAAARFILIASVAGDDSYVLDLNKFLNRLNLDPFLPVFDPVFFFGLPPRFFCVLRRF